MSESFYENTLARFGTLQEQLSLHPDDKRSICTFRRDCCALLQEMILNAEYAQDLKLSKLGMEIAADAAKTRICEERSDGCLITRPDPCPQDLRAICVKAYDKFNASVQARDKMFIPPRIERTEAGFERLKFAVVSLSVQNVNGFVLMELIGIFAITSVQLPAVNGFSTTLFS